MLHNTVWRYEAIAALYDTISIPLYMIVIVDLGIYTQTLYIGLGADSEE